MSDQRGAGWWPFGRRQKPSTTVTERVVRESNGAVLIERDGELRCRCPFACLATYEECVFA